MRNRELIERSLFRAGYGAVFVFLLAPLIIVVGTSVDQSGNFMFPPESITFSWYFELLQDDRWIEATKNSLIVASGTTILSTGIGVTTALGLRNLRGDVRSSLTLLVMLPLLVPPVVIAITLLIFFSKLGLQQSYHGLILAHSLWSTPIVFAVMQASFKRYDWGIREASMDLGATPARSYLEAVFPNVKDGFFAAILLSFVISLQEFVMAVFLSGPDTITIPVLAWNSLRRTLSPMVSAVSTLLLLGVMLIILSLMITVGAHRLARDI